uniref:ATP synthase F0 subunit 8 n=1 Tax=Scartella cristata TaxID=195084 RepID=UPI002B2F7FB1|nr:ATP synthase F0 subunit 8 [Scartella cristata]WNH21508.1 ATP synthase F0 subunit 8 [Scartella cristata]WQT71129.1 ATP synthase F0 subunit 8 [Scartella cristata]WQT71140.1 ATP synthase F0 subunit 8 [Scartella cristata]WQT73456.1 ATP synthase F0 subunit 8 [Scartella cristata]WQT73469.1 ATP synthase F0 subunit 8 [Scartella cristata]
MPQLNPAPWLQIFFFTWLVFLIIIPPKVLAHHFPNDPSSSAVDKPSTSPWPWRWQ